MDERATRQALRAMSPRMRGADIETLVEPVMKAWNDHCASGRLVATMAVIVDATWHPGYAAGTAHGHRFVTDYFAQAAKRTLVEHADRLDSQSQRMLQAVAGTAAAVAASESTATDAGPSRNDYLTAMGDASGTTDAEEAAIAARVGWTHGYQIGDADAGWSAAGRILGTVGDLIGEDIIRRVNINGHSGSDWLTRIDVDSRGDSAHDGWHPNASVAQAFSPLRQVSAMPITAPARSTSDGATQQRQGRSR